MIYSTLSLRPILVLFVAGILGMQSSLFAQERLTSPLINPTVALYDHALVGLDRHDKCGIIDEKALQAFRVQAGDGWGYGYGELLEDIEEWKQSPYVSIESLGKTVENRDIWELTITSTRLKVRPRKTVTIHARTHPHETQSWWVCENVIKFLLSDDPFAEALREQCTFYIIPMYNPDGVELETTRYNANGVDLEREWGKQNPQVEAAVLKRRFSELMNSAEPIVLALNLHSSSDPERYFWFHDESGTSVEFANLERQFIAGVRDLFARIMPWDYAVSWKGSAPTHFPESWFWFNYGTDVMALTYEDVFSHNLTTQDAHFDSAAFALLHGVADYLQLNVLPSSTQEPNDLEGIRLNVIGAGQEPVVHYQIPQPTRVNLTLFDGLGRMVTLLHSGEMEAGDHRFAIDALDVPSGVYFVQLHTSTATLTERVIIIR